MARRLARGRNHRNSRSHRVELGTGTALLGWCLFFTVVLVILFRSDPVLFLQPRADDFRVDSHMEPSGGFDGVALYASANDDRPWLLVHLGGGNYEARRGTINHRIVLEEGDAVAPLIVARSASTMAVAQRGGSRVAVLEEMPDGFLQVDVTDVPEGQVTGLFASPESLYILSTRRTEPADFAGSIPSLQDGVAVTLPPVTVVEDQLYYWLHRGLFPAAQFPNSVVLGHASVTMKGRVPGSDAFLVGSLPESVGTEPRTDSLEVVFMEAGRTRDRWPLTPEYQPPWPVDVSVPTWLYQESWVWSADRTDLLLWRPDEISAWGPRGESVQWIHTFPDSSVRQVLLTDAGVLVATEEQVWRVDRRGSMVEVMALEDEILEMVPLPGAKRRLLIVTRAGVGVFTTEGQVLWQASTDRPIRDWTLLPLASEGEALHYQLHILMAHGMERHRIEMIP